MILLLVFHSLHQLFSLLFTKIKIQDKLTVFTCQPNLSAKAMLEVIELNAENPAKFSVIWLHGLGADGNDFVSLVPELNLSPDLPVRFVFPHAPIRSITINNRMRMRAWYDIVALSLNAAEDEKGIRDSQQRIITLLHNEYQRGIPYENIILAGFSQGGAMALFTGLRFPHKLRGIMGLSCYLPLAMKLKTEQSEANRITPIFMAHGQYDSIVPLPLGEWTRSFLIKQDYSISWHTYPIDHSVSVDEIHDISNWIQSLFRNSKN